ncbi:hypothetical protein K7B10_40135 [Streptomyces flavotricini]|uniref:Uncharacterized protein n=1 Tax=Streptomyces flavotricini TaxID=66888 RepID=A0ABS8EI86_9ACTN|nr:hypothetical protein [Streptomyces flavotricini]MCC0100850.1 hypothetical protein [Streptomyces flavotricini]
MWDYAEFSAEARKLGGPDALRAAYVRKGLQKGFQKGIQVGVRLGQRQGFVAGVITIGVPVVGWKAFKEFRDRRAAAATQAVVGVSETVTTTEEAVIAEAEAVIATVEVAPVVDEPERAPGPESSSPAAAQSATVAGEDVST